MSILRTLVCTELVREEEKNLDRQQTLDVHLHL